MKAIIITQELKDLNPNFGGNVNTIKTVNNLPRSFYSPTYNNGQRTDAYHTLDNAIHEADGFYDVINPSYNSSTQYLGNLYFDDINSYFTYPVNDYTQEELDQKAKQQAISQNQSIKQALIQAKLEAQVVSEAQASDDTESLDNQALFPMWEYPFDYTLGFKCQSFNADNELKLYKCVQAHASQADWMPKDVPALFSVVSYPGQIDEWVQPTGAQDAYQIGDQVTWNGSTWESNTANNVWEPGVFGWDIIS